MKMNGCILCGGKLKNGICLECGMDNRKSDRLYMKRMNRSDCTDKDMSHVHEQGKVKKYEQPPVNKNREKMEKHTQTAQNFQTAQKQEAYHTKSNNTTASKYREKTFTNTTFTEASNGKNRKSANGKKGTKIALMLVILSMLSVVSSLIFGNNTLTEQTISKELDRFQEDGDAGIEYDYYEPLEEELNPEGEGWEQKLSAGMYMVGFDIPEGEYTIYMTDGNVFEAFDYTHNIMHYQSFDAEDKDSSVVEGIKLFQGALVCVDGKNPIHFVTENGQVQDMVPRAGNPLTESVELTGRVVSGKAFPAGTYDIVIQGDSFGSVRYEVPQSRENDSPDFYEFSVFMEENPTEEYPYYCSEYKNVVLPEGSIVSAEGFTIKLVPSAGMITEDYSSFYKNMY